MAVFLFTPYLSVLGIDAAVYLGFFVVLLLTKRRSWLGAFRPVVFRLATLSLGVRFLLSWLVSTRIYMWLVVVGNAAFLGAWIWVFRSLDSLIRRPEVRSVQIWVLSRRVEIVSIYKNVQGSISDCAARSNSSSLSCPICLQSIAPVGRDRRRLSLAWLRRRVTLAARFPSQGVLKVLTTPCQHAFHADCIGRCLDRLCPLCKKEVGVSSTTVIPFP
jgi:hypothetical protein